MNTATLTQVEALELVAIELDLDAILTEEFELGLANDLDNPY